MANGPLEGHVELIGLFIIPTSCLAGLALHKGVVAKRFLTDLLGPHDGELRRNADAHDQDDCEDPHHCLPRLACDEIHGHYGAEAHGNAGGTRSKTHGDAKFVYEPLPDH